LYCDVYAESYYGVDWVELYIDGYKIRREDNKPWEWGKPHRYDDYKLNNMSPGTYELKAVAKGYNGMTTTEYVTITVGHHQNGGGYGPTITYESLYDGVTVGAYKDIYCKVNIHDNDGVKWAKLYVDGHYVRTENSAPYEWGKPHARHDYALNNMSPGTYELTIKAKDNYGYISTKTITVYVQH